MVIDGFYAQLHRLAHYLCKWASFRGHRYFHWATKHLQQVQEQRLGNIIDEVYNTPVGVHYGLSRRMSIRDFQEKIPISDYADWQKFIEEQRSTKQPVLSHSPCNRYQPTSGSTSAIKWIPYTKSFLSELDCAISPWMWDLYKRYPALVKGRHYWSLSWIPSELRQNVSCNINDDLKLLPWWKRVFMSLIMAVPDAVSQSKSSEESWFKTLCYLSADSSLSMVSVWSPTFALNILEGLAKYRIEIAAALQFGRWPLSFTEIKGLPCPHNKHIASILVNWDGEVTPRFLQTLWPNLVLISAWDTSTAALWAEQLHNQLPFAKFQGKGLWATEGVVTFPLGDKYPLAINSHFYEFIDSEDGQVYLPWELKLHQRVRPVLTTGSGLLRYAMKDLLKVVGFINQCPCLEFLGRVDGTDMVGEKMSTEVALTLLKEFETCFGENDIKPISLVAVQSEKNTKPYYLLLCKHNSGHGIWREEMQYFLEDFLKKHFHYQLSRDLNQLGRSRLVITPKAWELYQSLSQRRGMVVGNLKVEPLLTWDDHIPQEFLQDQLQSALA